MYIPTVLMILPCSGSAHKTITCKSATYYLRDRFEPFCPEVELAGAVVLAPALVWLLTSSLLLGLVSDTPGGSFRFSVQQIYSKMSMVYSEGIITVGGVPICCTHGKP
jgi:hypothetical protein